MKQSKKPINWMHLFFICLAVIIGIGSAIMTGAFGSNFSGGSWIWGGILFLIFAAMSGLCPILINQTASNAIRLNFGRAMLLAPFAVFFTFYDVVTNGGTSSFIRQSDMVLSDNQNVKAKNARADVKRLEGRIAEIRADTAWTGNFRAPGAYDKLITNGERYVELETARGGCGPKCEARMRELDGLRSERVNAERREVLRSEMATLERELKDAKAAVIDTPTKASAALTHAGNFASAFTGQIEPDAKARFWANYGLSALMGIAITTGNVVAGILLAFSGAGFFAGSQNREDESSPWIMQHRQLHDQRPEAAQATADGQTIVLQNRHDHTDDSLATLMEAVQRINARYAT